MPGMTSGLNANNPTVVSAFQSALAHQGLIVLALLAVLFVLWRLLRLTALQRAGAAGARLAVVPEVEAHPLAGTQGPEAPARRVLRMGFALLWLLDALLQMQPQMPLGMTAGVIRPAAATSPHWVQDVVNAGTTIWNFHPVTAAASAVWIQLGIGLFLLVAPRGIWSRLAGAASAGWGVLVWVFGEAFGGIFAPGLSWLFGAPGAVVLYALAGVLIALPERVWVSPRSGRTLLGGVGAFFLAMALLQAWPGRGFWQGHFAHPIGGSRLGSLALMAKEMSTTPQPRAFSRAVSDFASFDVAHGFAVNLFVVCALALIGAALLSGRAVLMRAGVVAAIVLCLADWLLVEDLGFFGGVGTDPNSMVPMIVLLVAGAAGLFRAPAPASATDVAHLSGPLAQRFATWRRAAAAQPSYLLRFFAGLGAIGVVLIGAVPMAVASVNPNASTLIAAATDGSPDPVHFPASPFRLTDAAGRPVSLASLRGRTVALTFLDPVCTFDCPLIAQEMIQTDHLLAHPRHYALVAVDANPLYEATSYLRAFDAQEGTGKLANWLYLTGSSTALHRIWNSYGVQDQYSPGGAMVAHTDIVYVIDRHGFVREVLNADPGAGTAASKSSFAVTLANALHAAAA